MSSIEQWKADLIAKEYATCDIYWLSEKTGMKVGTLRAWARKRQIRREVIQKTINPNWLTEDQVKLIEEMYPTGDLDILSQKLNKSKHAIGELARKRGIRRLVCTQRRGDLSPLFDKSLISMYWLGFIATDGYISKDGHLMISQSIKDRDSIESLAQYLDTKPHEIIQKTGYDVTDDYKTYRVSVCDKVLGRSLREMFGLLNDKPKTYTGINLDFITNENQAAAFFAGCLNGDGNRQPTEFRIECEKSWFETYKTLIKKLPSDFQNIDLSIRYKKSADKEYCVLRTRKSTTNEIVDFAIKNQLPLAPRKLNA
jgi:hypothetical protein